MKYKKVLIIICAVIFFLAALTSYLNRIIFPQLIKKIAIERIESVLKRKVEIGSIRFNWVRGFVIDKIKVYEKNSNDVVFAQADQISFGVILFPGFKHYRVTIPFINVRSPSVHLIRTAEDTWNFSDMLSSSSAMPAASPSVSPAFEIAWGGIAISDGKLLVNDISNSRKWSEFFNNINLKLSLSYKGISYDFTADIPGKNGSIGAIVYYQPITKNTQAQIHLKNIDTASYLSLVNIPDVHLDSGLIKEINLDMYYAKDKTSAKGDIIMQDLDITSQDENFKGNVEIRNLDAQYQNGNITAHGQLTLNNIQTRIPGLSAGGSVQTNVNDFEFSPQGTTFIGSLNAQNIFVRLKDRQIQADGVNLDNIRVRQDSDGVQSVGSIKTQGLIIQWPDQMLRGDIGIKNITMRMKDENNISLEGDLQADHFSTRLGDKSLNSRHILLDDAQMNILNEKDIALVSKLSMDDMSLQLGKNTLSAASLRSEKLSFNLVDGIIKASSSMNFSHGKLNLGNHKIIEADPQLELTVQIPLSTPQEITYKASITLSDGHIEGFSPIATLDNIELDTDFQNDEATINALSINVLDTNIHITGTVKDFKDPFLNITADADELNLAKIREILPHLVDQYGLSFDGSSFVKVHFEGLASKPLKAQLLVVASIKNVSVTSNKFHQRIKNITGIVEATHDSLKWRDFTATYLDKKYTFAGSLENFKAPKIFASIEGPSLQINANLVKDNEIITINSLSGKYMNASFDSTGSITLLANGPFFDINTNASMLLEDLIQQLPAQPRDSILPLKPSGTLSMNAELKGRSIDWKNFSINASIKSPLISLMGYKLNDMKITIDQQEGKIKNSTFDGTLYDGTVHAVGSLDLTARGMPYDLALNIDNADLHQFKVDSPLKMQEIDGKFFLTTLAHGTVSDFKNNVHATGSLAIRDGYLGEFNLFKGLLDVLNDAMSLSKVMITDVEANFTIDDQKINTDNLRLKGPTIVLLGKGWVNFDQICDLNMTVDLSSGVVPAIAHDVLKSLNIHIYDKISDPKFKKKISVPQVINTLIKNLLQ